MVYVLIKGFLQMTSISSTSNTPFIKIDAPIFFNRSIKPICREIYALALDLSKIPGWIIRKKYIADQLDVSLRTVNRYFNLLVKLGYAYYDEVKHRWHVFRTPKPNKFATSTGGGLPLTVEGGLPLVAPINQIENYSEEKTTTAPHAVIIHPDPVTPVVVFEKIEKQVETITNDPVAPVEKEDLKFPDSLTKNQKDDAKHALKKVKNPALRHDVLAVLAHNLIHSHVRSIPAYLNDLINRANNGTLGPIPSTGGTILDTRRKDDTQERMEAQRAADAKPKNKDIGRATIAGLLRGVAR